MPKRTDIDCILIIGAGPIVIGQACEFDYSGAQACKALREEGYRVVLVNSNPATIMTDPDMADSVYIEPVDWRAIERVIDRERPDALLPTMGGSDRPQYGPRSGARGRPRALRGGTGRRIPGRHRHRRRPRPFSQGHARDRARGADIPCGSFHAGSPRDPGRDWLSDHYPAVLYLGRERRRHCLQPGRVHRDRGTGPGPVAHDRGTARGVCAGLERVRNGGRSRYRGQLHHRLLHRKPRSHGRTHRRLHHGGSGANADRQGISSGCGTHRSRCFAGSAWTRAGQTSSSPSARTTGEW